MNSPIIRTSLSCTQLNLTNCPYSRGVSKFNLELPSEVEEYYEIKKKCLAAGWEPGKVSPQFLIAIPMPVSKNLSICLLLQSWLMRQP